MDVIDIGLFHAVQKLPRVGTEAFDVAPLPLGIERIECQRRLSGTADPRDHDELLPRNLNGDILQVVDPSTFD